MTARLESHIPAEAPTIVLTANSMRNLGHFRLPLFKALNEAGFHTVAMAPEGTGDGTLPPAKRIPIYLDRGGINPFADLRTIAAYVRAFRRLWPAAILGFTPKANIYAGIAARLCGFPFIPTVSGLGTGFLAGGLVMRVSFALYRFAFATAKIVFFQNPDDLDEFVRLGLVDREQARLVPGSGIDLIDFRAEPFSASDRTRLLFVGRFLADKGLRELVEAIREVRGQGHDVELTLVGTSDPGNPTSIGQEEIGRWEAAGLVHNVGEQADVRPFMANANAVVLPSYREGLPRVLLEAGAMARPMIATDVPGCREIVVDGETGLLCEVSNSPSLAAAIGRFIAMGQDERQRMGKAARKLVEKRFDEARVVEQYRDALSQIGVIGPAER